MKKIIIFLSAACILFSTSAMALPDKVIRFGTEATYPPFEYVNEFGQIKGFDIDIAKAVCQQMGAVCTFATQSFSSLIPSLKLGKFDAIIAAIGITPERQQQINFTNSYYVPSACFVAAKEKHYTLANIEGKTIGVQEGTTFAKFLTDQYNGKVKIKTYASIQDAFLDLVAGRVDSVITDTPIASAWLKQDDNNQAYTIIDKPILDTAHFGAGYGMGVSKDNPELLAAFNTALAEIKANGTYDKLVSDYFGVK